MNLSDYLRKTATSQRQFAELVGVTQGRVSQWLRPDEVIPPERCIAIEAATKGQVTKSDLRPDLWPPAAAKSRRKRAA